jgi:alkaline phosphatase
MVSNRNRKIRSVITLIVIIVILGCGFVYSASGQDLPKNIILFIGDGMGVAHVTAGMTVGGTLNLERCTTGGHLTTHSSDRYITDSAAGATAMSTGVKTYNGAISVSPSGETLKTVLEYAEDTGKTTGLVATCRITHATPACFAAHIDDRDKEDLIAEQLVQSQVDVVFGGGMAYFLPASEEGSERKDEKNLIAQWQKTHKIIQNPREFRNLGTESRVVGLFAMDDPPRAHKRKISLSEMTQKAIQILSKNEKGFFLMVEGSQIDWEAHDNDSKYLIQEMIDFDLAVGVGLDFAESDGQTLIVVTADHETGGYTVEGGSVEQRKITRADFTTTSHTGEMVPLFSFGPGSQRFGGIHDNTFVGITLIEMVKQH